MNYKKAMFVDFQEKLPGVKLVAMSGLLLPWRSEYVNMTINKKETARAMKEDIEALLLPDFSAHTLRHTFCTRFCENETNLKVIQDIMGHADISTTMDIFAKARWIFLSVSRCLAYRP